MYPSPFTMSIIQQATLARDDFYLGRGLLHSTQQRGTLSGVDKAGTKCSAEGQFYIETY